MGVTVPALTTEPALITEPATMHRVPVRRSGADDPAGWAFR
jgi:hypothetical protein